MRLNKILAFALIAVAVNPALTACGSKTGAADTVVGASSTSPTPSTRGALATSDSSAASSTCKTDNLGFSVSATGIKHELVVSLKNNSASTCSMHGFPGVKLVESDGVKGTGAEAALTDISPDTPPTVTIAPGEETRFLLNYIPAIGGSGKTFTKLSVAAPKDRVSKIVDLKALDITIAAPGTDVPDIYVDPIGYHVGYGK
ncbi:DUF4232 domain-containing protein [Streptomyces sp. NPDC093509]|uniref:DUF4232 domain-containing protein n=1 Tax=Streptomyces sp. NPDC093509 TaxID=3154982 RepID=UPI00344C5B65